MCGILYQHSELNSRITGVINDFASCVVLAGFPPFRTFQFFYINDLANHFIFFKVFTMSDSFLTLHDMTNFYFNIE